MVVLSTTETLFGGLLAVMAIFSVARHFKLPNYWSGVLGGGLPFLAYLGYGMKVEQAGDMVAIHLAVFLATAAVLGVFGAARKSKEKMHWAPKLIALFFVALAVFMAILLSISSHGLPDFLSGLFLPNPDKQRLHTTFPGVIPHDRNKLYEPHMQRMEAQRNLGWKVDVIGLDTLRSKSTSRVTVNVHDADGKPVVPDSVEIGLWRMANSEDDRHFTLQPDAAGTFATELLLPDPGRWLFEVTVTRGKDSHSLQRTLNIEEPNLQR